MARGSTEAQLGILSGALTAGGLLGALPAGWLIHRIGLKRGLLFCIAFTPAMLCARGIAPGMTACTALSVLCGAGLSLWAVCLSPAVASICSAEARPLAFGILFSSGIGLGAAGALLGSRIPGWLLTHTTAIASMSAAYRVTLSASCLPAIVGLWPASGLRLSARREGATGHVRFMPGWRGLSHPLKRLLAAAAVWGLVTGSFAPFANVYLSNHLHLGLRRAGDFFSASQLAQVAAVLLASLVCRRMGVIAGVWLAQLGTALCFLLLAASDRTPAAAFLFPGLTAFQWMNEPGLYTLLMEWASESQRPAAAALMSAAISSAQLIAALAAGWAFARLGYGPVFAALACLAVVSALLVRVADDGATSVAAPAERRAEVSLSGISRESSL